MRISWILIFLSLPLTAQEIPDSLEQRIKKEVTDAILDYRAWVNPEIPQESYSKYYYSGTLESKYVGSVILLPRSILEYEMILEVKPWVAYNGYVRPHLYIVHKEGNCFTNPYMAFKKNTEGEYILDDKGEEIIIEAYEDTLCLDLYDQHFPYDEWYLVYYNPDYRDEIFRISGAFTLTKLPLPDPEWTRKIANVGAGKAINHRLFRYGKDYGINVEAIFVDDTTGRGKMADINKTDKGGEYYLFKTRLPIWVPDTDMFVRVKKEDIWFSEIEFVFYTNDSTITKSEENWPHEIIYTLHTDKFDISYEDTLPQIRRVPLEEYRELMAEGYGSFTYIVDWEGEPKKKGE